jgi:hypothetical protein
MGSSAAHVTICLDGADAPWDWRSRLRSHREATSTGSSMLASLCVLGVTGVRHHGSSTRGSGGSFKRLIVLELGENHGHTGEGDAVAAVSCARAGRRGRERGWG